MTQSLSIAQLAIIVAACFLWGVVVGAAVMLDVMWPRKQAGLRVGLSDLDHGTRYRVSLDRLADPEPLPWEHELAWSAWAADMEDTLSAADAYIARHPEWSAR